MAQKLFCSLNWRVVGKPLTLQDFVKGGIDFPQPYLDLCWLLKVLESAEQKVSSWQALLWTGSGLMPASQPWVMGWASTPAGLALPLPCRIPPGELRTSNCLWLVKKTKKTLFLVNQKSLSLFLLSPGCFGSFRNCIAWYWLQLLYICISCAYLHASAMFLMARKGLAQGAGGKQPSCKKLNRR